MASFKSRNSKPLDLLDLELQGANVRLVPTAREHAQEIFREFTPLITRYMFPRPAENLAETWEFIDSSRDRMKAGANLQLTILSRDEGRFLGCCGLHGEGKERSPEVGIWLKRAAHGHGYGPESIALLVEWAFENLEIEYIVYPADRRNTASRSIPESLGGAVFDEQQATGLGGNELDLVLYRIDPR